MKYPIYQIDAFTDTVFSGNSAAICPLTDWLSNDLMQNIAMENNLSETAFYVKKEDKYHIRWFTPTMEVDLCGHATLAAAYVLFNFENHLEDVITFYSEHSGILLVKKNNELLTLNFPTDEFHEIELSKNIKDAFDKKPITAFKGKTDYLIEFETEKEIQELIPNFEKIASLKERGVIVTAKGDTVDFVSRFFGPQSGINEDPVTGSAHTTLTPFWSKKLSKKELIAHQLSSRKGVLTCSFLNERVEISGKCKLYMKGEIYL